MPPGSVPPGSVPGAVSGAGAGDRSTSARFSRARRARASARTSVASRPATGEASSDSARSGPKWSASAGSATARSTTARSASSNGITAGSATSGVSSLATSTGTPAAPRARLSRGIVPRPERTSTAISDQGSPSSRWARRSRSATCSVSARSVSKVSTSARPDPNGPAWASGCRNAAKVSASIDPVVASPDTTARDSRSSRGPNRRVTRSATVPAGVPSVCGNARGKSRMPRTSAPRKA